MRTKPDPPENTALDERVRSILASKNFTLSQVSQVAAARFGRSSPCFLPHTLYYELRLRTFRPSLHQVFAFSQISGFRFADWLRVFGFDLENIPRLQVLLPSKRTILLDSSWVDPDAWVPWLRNRSGGTPVPPIAPLAQLVEYSGSRRLRSVPKANSRRFLYAKIGHQDTLPFPDLLPGSIVRVNPSFAGGLVPQANGATSNQIFLIEHSKGFFCCRLRAVGDNVIVPVSTLLSYAQVELLVPHEARVVGVVDLEIRPLVKPQQPEVPRDLAKHWKSRPLARPEKLGELLRSARTKMRLSLREAAGLSRRVADLLSDDRYFVSPSSLCDYELLNTAPRDFHKSITLCLVYGLDFHIFLEAIGIPVDKAGTESMPDHLVPRVPKSGPNEEPSDRDRPDRQSFLEQLLAECEEIPFFLRNATGPFSGLADAALGSYFWIGGQQDVLYPYLTNGLLVLVNRRRRRPLHFTSKPVWQQPVYMILVRDRTYLCASCGVENGTLVIHPYTQQFHRSERLRYHHDAEIIGQIVAVARKLV